MRLGERSRWYGYLQSLPRDTVMIPLFWGESSLAASEEERLDGEKALVWLKSTEVARDLDHKAKDGLNLVRMPLRTPKTAADNAGRHASLL